MIKVGDKTTIIFKRRAITGTVVGIDNYTLQNFTNRTIRWPSYTLVSEDKGVFKRYWFVCWGNKDWVLWLKPAHNKVPAGAKMLLEKSGLAKITFTGDAGVSTPTAALATYGVGKNYFCAERFADSKTMFFDGFVIPKPKRG